MVKELCLPPRDTRHHVIHNLCLRFHWKCKYIIHNRTNPAWRYDISRYWWFLTFPERRLEEKYACYNWKCAYKLLPWKFINLRLMAFMRRRAWLHLWIAFDFFPRGIYTEWEPTNYLWTYDQRSVSLRVFNVNEEQYIVSAVKKWAVLKNDVWIT